MRFKLETPKEGTTKEVRKFAFFPKIVDDGSERNIIWLEYYYAIYEYMWFPSCGHQWVLKTQFVDPDNNL